MPHQPHRRRRRNAAWLLPAVLLTGCLTQADAQGAAPVREEQANTDVVPWGDDYDHVVVTVDVNGPVVTGPATIGEPEGGADEDGAGTLVVDGARSERIDVPDGSLRTVEPRDESEHAMVEAASGSALALVVVDDNGGVGPAGARYLMTPGRLERLDGAALTAPVEEAPSEQAPSEQGDPVEMLLALPGVVSATPVTDDTFAVALDGSREALLSSPVVRSVADDVLLGVVVDPDEAKQWWLKNTGGPDPSGSVGTAGADVKAEAGWRVSTGTGTVVAVIDSGVELNHPDLSSRLWTNSADTCGNGVDDDSNGFVDDCNGWDFGGNDNNPNPEQSAGTSNWYHGTHVAGIIAAARNNVGVVGLAPDARIMPIKVMASNGAISSSAIYGALVYAADNGADVVNMSIATAPNTARAAASALEAGIQYATARGVIVVAAAGNNSVDIGAQPLWPANYSLYYPSVITVGSTTNTDAKSSFSNYGAPVNLFAPGSSIYSSIPGGSWTTMSGTSMAAPVVAGAVADILASPLRGNGEAIRTRLTGTAAATAAGRRLDLGAAVAGADTRTVVATYTGANLLAPDTAGTIGVDLTATAAPTGATQLRLYLGAQVNGEIYAVSTLTATITSPSGTVQGTTDYDGGFPSIPIANPAALPTTPLHVDFGMQLPAGRFALVTELQDAGGTAVGGTSVGFIHVGESAASPTTTTVPGSSTTIAPGAPTTTSAPGAPTTVVVPPTSSPATVAPTTVAPGSPVTTAPAPATTAPGSATTVAPGVPTTAVPVTTSAPSPTTSPAPVTTAAPTTVASTSPATTVPAVTTSSVAPTTTLSSSTTTVATTTTVPASTPAPLPDSSGPWRFNSISPSMGPIAGGSLITISGVFPTTVPIYVWFGTVAIVQTTSTGSTLVIRSPYVPSPGVVDVDVRFRTSDAHVMTLASAFTFYDPTVSTTTVAPGAPTTTSGTATTAPATTVPGTGTTVVSPVTTAAPGSSTPATTVSPTTLPSLGSLTLRQKPSTGGLARLAATAWPATGCATSSCSTAPL
jgi:serine protease